MPQPSPNFSNRFRTLVDRLIDGEISSDEVAELERELENSAPAREFLADALVFSEELRAELTERSAAGENSGLGKPKPAILLAALGGALACLLALICLLSRQQAQPAAFVDRVEGAQWLAPLPAPAYDSEIPLEQRVELKDGHAAITFPGGARVMLEGPCAATFHREHSLTLHGGKLVLSMPQHSPTFTINSAGYEIQVAADATNPEEGNLYGLLYDEDSNLLQTSVYSGNVSIRPNGAGKPARHRLLPVANQQPVADSFRLVFEPTPSAPASRIPLQLEADGRQNYRQIVELPESGLNSARLITNRPLRPGEVPSVEISGRRLELKLPRKVSQPPGGSLFVYRDDRSQRRSDFLGLWEVSRPHAGANQAGFAKIRLRSDGTVLVENGVFEPFAEKTLTWTFRAGSVVLRDDRGTVVDEWSLIGRTHLSSAKDSTLLMVRR